MDVHHHVKYLEIDGVDEIEVVPAGFHRELHNHSHIPKKVSVAAHDRMKQHIYLGMRIDRGVYIEQDVRYNPYTGSVCVVCWPQTKVVT